MPSLLDNAAPGGLLADPRPSILAQLFDMSVKKRPTILPMFTQQNGRIGLTAPQLLVDAVNSAMLPYAAAQGYRATPTDVSKMAMDTMLGGGLLGRAPSGSLAVNVWHGGPHRWAAEPGFPYGRPRLDKMGTGEGAQAYGPGFYTGEAQGVAKTYKAPEGFYKRITGQLDPKTETAFDLIEGGASTSDVMELMLSKYGGDISFDEVIKAIDGARDVGAGQGTLYKLDIPDADAAKMLDWDKPLSQQSKSVQDGLKKAAPTLDIEGRDSVMTGGVFLEKFGGLQDNMRENVARQLSDVGIPGVKYLDQGSRGAGDGTRNYSIWDQDVLDRTKMLERDGVTLGANKSRAAAATGLLGRTPAELRAEANAARFGDEDLSINQTLAQSAKDYFGITRDPSETGYILQDGTRLDLSGRHYAGGYVKQGDRYVPEKGQSDYLAGDRAVDHRELYDLPGIKEGDHQWSAVENLMTETGAVRYLPNIGFSVIAGQKVSDKQLRKIVSDFRKSKNPLEVDIDPVGGGSRAISKTFENPTVDGVREFLNSATFGANRGLLD